MRYAIISYVGHSLLLNAFKILIDFDFIEPLIASLKGFITYDLQTAINMLQTINNALTSILKKISEDELTKWVGFSDEGKTIEEIIIEKGIDVEDLNITLIYLGQVPNFVKSAKALSLYFVTKGIPTKTVEIKAKISDLDERARALIRAISTIIKDQLAREREVILVSAGAPEPERTILKLISLAYGLEIYDLVNGKLFKMSFEGMEFDKEFFEENTEILGKLIEPIPAKEAENFIGNNEHLKKYLRRIEKAGKEFVALDYLPLIFYYKI